MKFGVTWGSDIHAAVILCAAHHLITMLPGLHTDAHAVRTRSPPTMRCASGCSGWRAIRTYSRSLRPLAQPAPRANTRAESTAGQLVPQLRLQLRELDAQSLVDMLGGERVVRDHLVEKYRFAAHTEIDSMSGFASAPASRQPFSAAFCMPVAQVGGHEDQRAVEFHAGVSSRAAACPCRARRAVASARERAASNNSDENDEETAVRRDWGEIGLVSRF